MYVSEQGITIDIEPSYKGHYADHGVEFERISFLVPPGTDPARTEQLISQLPGCRELFDFGFIPATGTGHFILMGTTVPPGTYTFSTAGHDAAFSFTPGKAI